MSLGMIFAFAQGHAAVAVFNTTDKTTGMWVHGGITQSYVPLDELWQFILPEKNSALPGGNNGTWQVVFRPFIVSPFYFT